MKHINALIACLVATATFTSAQTSRMMPAVSSPAMADDGTELGANTTLTSSGIALGNRVKMRGFVDFRYDYTDLDNLRDDDARFRTAADVDFLFDFSPVTGEVHLAASSDEVGLEQAFIRYNFNQDFSISAGRQLTVLGFEKDESPNMYQTSYAYISDLASDVQEGSDALKKFVGIDKLESVGTTTYTNIIAKTPYNNVTYDAPGDPITGTVEEIALRAAVDSAHHATTAGAMVDGFNPTITLPNFRRNYVDGVRLNFNNGQFGFVAGLHNGYFTDSEHLNDGNVGLDIAASVMIIPGLEFRLGFGYENNDAYNDSISTYNNWARGVNTALNNYSTASTNPVTLLPIYSESDDISQFNFYSPIKQEV